ncbi:MAG TPA: nitroreductase family protein [Acidimicrobiia bacterium]|nr:nitroreductase family protein [Acidimicrobiia bacterium]
MAGDLYRQILSLRAIRTFDDRPLQENDLRAVLEAGRWTGTSKNRQNWSVVVVTDPSQRLRLAACGDFTDPIRRAPAALVLVQEPEGYEFDVGRVAQNLMLAAAALGMVSCPITLHRDAEAATVLELPAGRRSRYAVALGYPIPESSPARLGGRRPLDEFIHQDRYRG